ncbi:MAG: type II toxin-antitoxin system VapC family toxin [Coriobacteriia bacterium]|nr:type II toxin-antitoxin system VapC family toxin [Coriobacteriia bacterium]
MSESRVVVLDASVGVKWIRSEGGSAEAYALLEEHRQRRCRIVVPAHFIHEVVAVATRHAGADGGRRVWDLLRDSELTVVQLDDAMAGRAFDVCAELGCTFYDGLAPALARICGGTLYSADRRAHGSFEGVVLL